jgi:Amt family ammonium transporter
MTNEILQAVTNVAAQAAPAVPEFNWLDTIWVLIAGVLVFFMNAGFAFVETGFVRAKNAVVVMAKNFVVFGLATMAFWAVGYALMFKVFTNFGSGLFFYSMGTAYPTGPTIPEMAFFFFQLVFAGTAATIVSGAIAERSKFLVFVLFSLILVALVYPLVGMMIWNPDGFLFKDGFIDFAGSTVVHSVGGWAALAGIIILGPRLGKFSKVGGKHKVNVIPGHSMSLATLGTFILWLGWFGFNPGSMLAVNEDVIKIAVNTNMAGVTGMLTATLLSWIRFKKPDFGMMLNGLLGGLVAITAGCNAVTVGGAALIGTIAGVIIVYGVPMFENLGLDDPVGATSVHLLNGVAGTLLVGFFAVDGGLVYSGSIAMIFTQLKGIGYTAAIVFPISLIVWWLLNVVFKIRVPEKEEIEGLDVGEMGTEAYVMHDK